MTAIDPIFYIAVLIMSIVIHEVTHGFVAEYFGDKTARFAGRLTLNPLKHLDPFGSVILPAILVFSGSPFLIGWAKPVPYDPGNLKNLRWGEFWIASSGVLSNFFLALFFGILIQFAPIAGLPDLSGLGATHPFYVVPIMIVIVNISLGIFNLVPIPPLDGSKILFSFLPSSAWEFRDFLENYGFVLLLLFVVFFSDYLYPIASFLFKLFTGLQF